MQLHAPKNAMEFTKHHRPHSTKLQTHICHNSLDLILPITRKWKEQGELSASLHDPRCLELWGSFVPQQLRLQGSHWPLQPWSHGSPSRTWVAGLGQHTRDQGLQACPAQRKAELSNLNAMQTTNISHICNCTVPSTHIKKKNTCEIKFNNISD